MSILNIHTINCFEYVDFWPKMDTPGLAEKNNVISNTTDLAQKGVVSKNIS